MTQPTLREILRKVAADGAGLKFSVPEAEQQIESLIREREIKARASELNDIFVLELHIGSGVREYPVDRLAKLKGEQDVPRN